MENLKITQLLKSFTPEEFKKLGKFIGSPFHNESPMIIKLYSLFKNEYPDFSKPDFTRENIFTCLYPGEQYDDHKMRDRFSEFVKLTERFIVYNNISEDKYMYRQELLEYFKKRNLCAFFEKEITDLLRQSDNEILKDEKYFKKRFELKELHWDYMLSRYVPGSTDILDELVSVSEDIENFFLIKTLKGYLSIMNGQGRVNYDHIPAFFEYIMKYLDQEIHKHKDVKLIYILYKFFELYRENSNSNVYFELKKFVNENERFIDKKSLEVLYAELINYCQNRIEKGEAGFGWESLSLVKHMLKLDLLFESDNTIHMQNYSAIVSSALRLNEIQWAEEFINEYSAYLLPEVREGTKLYCMSLLYYVQSKQIPEKKNELLNESLDCLSMVQCNDFLDKLAVNNHLLVLYYELKYIDQLISLIDSYRHYLASNKLIPEEQKTRYHYFVNFLARVITLYGSSRKTNSFKLQEDIKSAPVCENRKWLLAKIDEILDTS
jgi:hypothetical protein